MPDSRLLLVAIAAAQVVACATEETPPAEGAVGTTESTRAASQETPACPSFRLVDAVPGIDAKYATLGYWLDRLAERADLDQVLLDSEAIDAANASLPVARDDYHPPRDLSVPFDYAKFEVELEERRQWLRAKFESGDYVNSEGGALPAALLAPFDEALVATRHRPELRVALQGEMIHCAPTMEGFFGRSRDPRLDYNACSAVRAQELVRVVGESSNGMKLVEAQSFFGWLPRSAELSPPVSRQLEALFVKAPRLEVVQPGLTVEADRGPVALARGTLLAPADEHEHTAYVATAKGFTKTPLNESGALRPTRRPLTRRALFEEAWQLIGTPYGLGDTGGGRDCSRLLIDAFASFNLKLPRHSSWQSKAGSFWFDVEGVPEAAKLALFDNAAERGIVILHFPGHIMLYLGRNDRGQPMVLHALGEYLEPCGAQAPGAGGAGAARETLVRVKNIGVSDLELGRGTSRRALIERVTRVTVVGETPGPALEAVAHRRPAAPARVPPLRACHDSSERAIYALPERPNVKQPLRIAAVMSEDPGFAGLTLIDPAGERTEPEVVRLGGPPFGQVATVEHPKAGRWMAVWADGENVLACQRILVERWRPREKAPDDGPVWKLAYAWHPGNENLYALFVERLFDYQLFEDRTWPNLHTLLRDAEHNLLFDYRGLGEEEKLELVPDCADLPYVLRAYFAWKLRLPFGFLRCSRGRVGRPPKCDEPGAGDNLMSRLELRGKGGRFMPRTDVEAFQSFVNLEVRSGVHSSSGRTLPKDDLTDLYPVPLTRQALKPGTVFADPYGHFLVIARWIPQPLSGSGILLGADAQPDGTVGLRRFWQGTFLFDPDTASGGAGFKAFRPRTFVNEPVEIELDAESSGVKPVPSPSGEDPTALPKIERIGYLKDVSNRALRGSDRFTRFSLEQYENSADDFYSKVETLINPRPLDPRAAQLSRVDALFEAVTRRVLSVDNGEKWAKEHPSEVIDMPDDDGIFLAEGPWEDFSTPSRDLRLLIAIDTVLGFPERVRRSPERFGSSADTAENTSRDLQSLLTNELAKRVFRYTRSDGAPEQLSLADVVSRAPAFEVAYNPNDCVEIRWGAPEGSAELATCRRHAPPEQRNKMLQYRDWFRTRKRPPR